MQSVKDFKAYRHKRSKVYLRFTFIFSDTPSENPELKVTEVTGLYLMLGVGMGGGVGLILTTT